ncbi:MAG TPA: hypothetical protein VGU66_21075, partial [Candidatus Elarobacter sp.]|nr:hypothetical protein [Candidatus Elarobacter sp.]
VNASGAVVLSNGTTDGDNYTLATNSGATANVTYSSLTVGSTVPVASQTMTLTSANTINSSDGSSVNVTDNGTANAAFVLNCRFGTNKTTMGAPTIDGGTADSPPPSGGPGRYVMYSRECYWAMADMAMANAAVILALATLETGIGFAAFLLATAAAFSAAQHMKAVC